MTLSAWQAQNLCEKFIVQGAILRNQTTMASSLKAKIFQSVSCNKSLKHEMGSTVCMTVVQLMIPGHVQDNYSLFWDIDLANYLGRSDIRCESLLSFLPMLMSPQMNWYTRCEIECGILLYPFWFKIFLRVGGKR